jgi:hypothetical protein
VRVEISNATLFRLPTSSTLAPLLLESSAFGTIVMTANGYEMSGGRDTRVVQSAWTAPGIHSVTIEFDYPEDAPLEMRLGGGRGDEPLNLEGGGGPRDPGGGESRNPRGGESRNLKREAHPEGPIMARLFGLHAVHAVRVEPNETIVHLRHALLAGAAPCQLTCPGGLSAQGPNHCIDCTTAIGKVTICC